MSNTHPATNRLVVRRRYTPRCSFKTIQDMKTVTTGVVMRIGATILPGRELMDRYRDNKRKLVRRPVS